MPGIPTHDLFDGGDIDVGAVTLGAWLELVDLRGWVDGRAWLVVQRAARAALPAVLRRLQPGEDDELVSDVVVLARSVPDSWRRPEVGHVGLVSWLAGAIKRRLLASRRAAFVTLGERLERVATCDPEEQRGVTRPAFDAAALLTPNQLAAWNLACRGLTARAAAQELGISRDAYRDRLRRAKHHIADGIAAARAPRP